MRAASTMIIAFGLGITAVHAKMPDPKQVQATIDAAVLQAFEEMKLGPAEKKVFDAEVVAANQPFVTNYKTREDGVDVQIDKEKLRNFLKFSAKDGMASPKFCVRVHGEEDCPICSSIAQAMQTRWLAKLEKRGFGFRLAPEPKIGEGMTGERAFDDFISSSGDAGCEAFLYTELERDRAPEQDDHGSEFRLKATSFLSLRENGLKKIRARADAVLLVPVSFDSPNDKEKALSNVLGRQSADLFAQAGSKLASETVAVGQRSSTGASQEESLLSLEKVQNYELYAKFKAVFAKVLPDVEIEERYVRPGVIQFAVKNGAMMAELPKRLQQADWQGKKLELIRSTPNEVVVALQ